MSAHDPADPKRANSKAAPPPPPRTSIGAAAPKPRVSLGAPAPPPPPPRTSIGAAAPAPRTSIAGAPSAPRGNTVITTVTRTSIGAPASGRPSSAGTQVSPRASLPANRPAVSEAPAQTSKHATRFDAEEIEQADAIRGPVWNLINQLHSLMKAVMLHDTGHSVGRQAAQGLCDAVAAMSPPFMLQFVAGGVFLDRKLVPLDFNHFERCFVLTRSLHKLRAHELSFETPLSTDNAARLGRALAAGARGQGDDLKGVELAGLGWREIPHAQSGIDAEGVDPEVAAVAHSVLGISVAEQIAAQPDQPWQWNLGLAVVRRLEKGLATNTDAAMRVVEFAPDGWPVSRRAVSAAQLVLQVLTKVNADPSNRRAVAHATLALALQGLRARDGVDLATAADALSQRMMSAAIQAKSGIAPQCLLVASIVHLMGSEMRRKGVVSLVVTDLIELAYEMERARCPTGVPFDLTRADLLAFAVQHGGERFSADWVRAVIKICGAVPVGACVQLSDGRVGIVIEPGPPSHPWCPVVFVDGQRVITREPVMLVPPHKLRRIDPAKQTRVGY